MINTKVRIVQKVSEKSLVSIVIPCYNHENYVQDSIQSAIDQTYKNIELIIIDDGSKDSSVAKIEEMIALCEQRFVRFEFRSRPNKGLSATLNEAIEWCRGEYYSAIASDDIMLKNKTAEQVDYLNNNENIVALFSGVMQIDENNQEIRPHLGEDEWYDFEKLIMHTFNLPAPTQMIRMDILKKTGGYDDSLFIEDWYMWLKLSAYGDIFYKKEILAFYRLHPTNSVKNLDKMQQSRIEVLAHFKESPYYRKAYRNIKWVNALESYKLSPEKKNQALFNMFLLKPFKVSNMFFKKFVRIVRRPFISKDRVKKLN